MSNKNKKRAKLARLDGTKFSLYGNTPVWVIDKSMFAGTLAHQ